MFDDPKVILTCDQCGEEEEIDMELRYPNYSGEDGYWILPDLPMGWTGDDDTGTLCPECSPAESEGE